MPERIQRRRVKGWRLPAGAKIVDRSSRWGNPFAVRRRDLVPAEWVVVPIREMPRFVSGVEVGTIAADTVLARFESRTEAHADAVARYRMWFPTSGLDITLLTGHDLACPCPPEYPCHADVLLELANPTEATHAR